jgi:hypothetical protein
MDLFAPLGETTMARIIPFKLGLDREKKRLQMMVEGDNGPSMASMDEEEIADFIAILTQCQHALVLLHAGQDATLPLDPNIAFDPVAGRFAVDYFEVHKRHAIGIDQQHGAVGLKILSRKGRLTSIRMSPEAARNMGAGLLQVADEVGSPQRKQ